MKLLASFISAALLACAAAVSFAATPAPAKAAKPDLVAGEAKFSALCVACHGTDGNSSTPVNPKLAQQHPEYLMKQLREYKNGARKNAIMQGIAAALTDDDMKNISFWLASQKAKPGFAKDKELVALGERIYRGGIAERQISACAGCHNPSGAGNPAQFPRLAGQHAEYTQAQLISYREGGRQNSVQMTQVAAKLNDREIRALADYVAGLR